MNKSSLSASAARDFHSLEKTGRIFSNYWKSSFALAAMITLITSLARAADALTPVADPQPLLQSLQQNMAKVKSVYLEFTQERQMKMFIEPLRSEGVMLIGRPDLIRWETTAPFQTILLGNEKSVAQFERNDGKWQKLRLGFPQMLQRVMRQMSLMNQGRLDAMTKDYTISVATGAVTVVTLVPKDETVRSVLASLDIRMLPDMSATREVVMNEPGGDLTRIVFTREMRDVEFPAKSFDQDAPLDVATIKAAAGHAP